LRTVWLCHSDYPLIALGEDKYALSTKCETAIGDLVTDAYKQSQGRITILDD
jgi:hypothetical protein